MDFTRMATQIFEKIQEHFKNKVLVFKDKNIFKQFQRTLIS